MSQSMFDRYGGFTSVSKIVMAFYDKALDSDIIGPYFEGADMRSLVDHQTKFISSIMGGPASYSNDQLARVHAHLNIDMKAMDEMVSLLEETFEEFDVDRSDIEQIVGELRDRSGHIMNTP